MDHAFKVFIWSLFVSERAVNVQMLEKHLLMYFKWIIVAIILLRHLVHQATFYFKISIFTVCQVLYTWQLFKTSVCLLDIIDMFEVALRHSQFFKRPVGLQRLMAWTPTPGETQLCQRPACDIQASELPGPWGQEPPPRVLQGPCVAAPVGHQGYCCRDNLVQG